eukprot:gene24886-45794_t
MADVGMASRTVRDITVVGRAAIPTEMPMRAVASLAVRAGHRSFLARISAHNAAQPPSQHGFALAAPPPWCQVRAFAQRVARRRHCRRLCRNFTLKRIDKSSALDTLATMRTFLLTLLLAILPLQFAWGAATGYCRHEAGTGATHFGHHEHQANASSGEKSKDLKQKTIADSDDCI